jgi:peptide/nickel transport system substrate-binding protein
MSKTMALKHATKDDPWASEWMRSNAPGAGPYMLESWTPGVEQVFVKNPGWYKGGAFPEPDIDRIIYRQVPESANRVALLMSGEAQIGRAFTMDEIDKLEKAPGVKVWCYAGNKFVWGGLNYELDPTKNPKLREALAYATPYQDILSAVYKGKAKPLYGYVTDTYGGFLGKDAFPYKTDYEKAKALLAEAGYPKGLDLTLSMSDNWPLHERIAVLLKDSYAKIGVNLSIQKKPAAAFKDDIFSRKAAFFLDEDYSFVLDPNYAAFVFLAKCNPPCWNTNGFRDEEFWATMDKARAMRDSPERTALMQWLQKRFYEDTPWIPVANVPTCFVTSDKVTGYHFHTNNQMYFFDLKLQQ